MDADHDQQELAIENEFRNRKGEDPINDIKDSHTTVKEFNEILMTQTEYLTADYVKLSRQLGYLW